MWKKVVKIAIVVLALVVVALGLYVRRMMPKFPEQPFVQPSGPYAVGTREYSWTDSSRAEPYTKDPSDHRRVVVQVWYPAVPGGADTARYLLRPDEFASRSGGRAASKSKTHAVLNAPVAESGGAFPVLVYNHGGAWTRWSATFTTQWLASYGYVVASVEHFGFNQTVKYPDGTPFAPDTLTMPKETGDGRADALASWAFLDDPVFPIWVADARFVLDQIEGLARDPGPFQGRLDLDRIGAFGWSFGGATAVQLTADDPRVKAAVDHDGQLFGAVRERGTTRPVMQLHNATDYEKLYPEKERPAVRELMAMTAAWDSTTRELSSGDWYNVTIAGTDHGDFSDLSLFYKRPKERIDARRAHEIINAYTLAFFDQYLRGQPSTLLSEEPSPFSEATFRARIRTPVPAAP